LGEQIANDVIVQPLFNEFGKCNTRLGHRGSFARKFVVQKQLSPGVTMAARSDYDGSRLIHQAPGHDHAEDKMMINNALHCKIGYQS
jgi:hypothetical protein